MTHLSFDYSNVVDQYVSKDELDNIQAQVTLADKDLREGTGAGNDFLGWIDWPENYDKEEYDCIKTAEKSKIIQKF